MPTIVITTQCDPTRVGLTYKIELPDWAFEDWWDQTLVRELIGREFVGMNKVGTQYAGANTGLTIFREGEPTEVHNFILTVPQLVQLLQSADYDFGADPSGRPGRPEKRVLISTTSKERRMKSSLTRQVAY
jgi:hypothetical protein